MKENETNIQKESALKKPWLQSLLGMVLIFGALGGFIFWQTKAGTVKIEDSLLDAPVVALAPSTSGTLNALYVSNGQTIEANTQVALVGTDIITAKTGGIVTDAPSALGGTYNPGETILSVVSTAHMRVRGSIEENKGLKDIAVGQRATFTIDAFPGKKYSGIVDEVSATANDASAAYSISDKRPTRRFDVFVRFDVAAYPELKNGMSAKITIYTKE